MTGRPPRVVDAGGQGWAPTPDGLYLPDYGPHRGLRPLRHPALSAQRGPLRPVRPATGPDLDTLHRALAGAGHRAVATLAAALAAQPTPGSLVAGDGYAWESRALLRLATWGAQLPPARVDASGRDTLAALVGGWVSDPHRYTEVAATVAAGFGRVADGTRSGSPDRAWSRVADPPLHPGGADCARGVAALAYLYLMVDTDLFCAVFAGEALAPDPRPKPAPAPGPAAPRPETPP
jgi:hypothetical protein